MEYRKMVLMNLFAGQQWENRHREQTYGHHQMVDTEIRLIILVVKDSIKFYTVSKNKTGS